MVFFDNMNFPVELIKGRWFTNLIRLLIHTRKIRRGTWDGHKVIRKQDNCRLPLGACQYVSGLGFFEWNGNNWVRPIDNLSYSHQQMQEYLANNDQ